MRIDTVFRENFDVPDGSEDARLLHAGDREPNVARGGFAAVDHRTAPTRVVAAIRERDPTFAVGRCFQQILVIPRRVLKLRRDPADRLSFTEINRQGVTHLIVGRSPQCRVVIVDCVLRFVFRVPQRIDVVRIGFHRFCEGEILRRFHLFRQRAKSLVSRRDTFDVAVGIKRHAVRADLPQQAVWSSRDIVTVIHDDIFVVVFQ